MQCALYEDNLPCSECNVGKITKNDCETLINKKCVRCGKKLIPIGEAKINGSYHKDWATRKYHKKCYKMMKQDQEQEQVDDEI